MITNEELEKRGYKKWGNDISHTYSDYFYQKKYADDLGVKYFIQFVHYPEHVFNNDAILPESWMVELNNNEPNMTLQWHKADSIQAAEDKCEMFFRIMGCEYYELYETQTS